MCSLSQSKSKLLPLIVEPILSLLNYPKYGRKVSMSPSYENTGLHLKSSCKVCPFVFCKNKLLIRYSIGEDSVLPSKSKCNPKSSAHFLLLLDR
ncbi:unnamed protein product [Moneuplotes crassus]|uniref:Uncharacterized protein n=1 Tax=Euplotes crassus TaxID=5936 RepID=A0AAD2D8D1_EUPCR|nr:unnamed protein product [Moneuplotes crassus]